MIIDKLQEIGFSEREAKVYVELLKIGPQAVSVVAKKLAMNRTTAYSVIKSLEKKGVIASYENSHVKYFVANDPNSLIGYFDRKCKTYDYYRSQLLSAIPEFRLITEGYQFKRPVVRYFEGIEGVKHVMYDALSTGKIFRSYLSLSRWLESGMKDFLLDFRDFRIKNKKILLKAIVPDTSEVRAFFKMDLKNEKNMTDVLYVSVKDFSAMFENGMNIYEDKVSIMHLDEGAEYGVVIQSKEVADMHKVIFDMAWNGFKVKNSEKV